MPWFINSCSKLVSGITVVCAKLEENIDKNSKTHNALIFIEK